MSSSPLGIFLLMFAFIILGTLLSQLGEVIYDTWEDWRKNNEGR